MMRSWNWLPLWPARVSRFQAPFGRQLELRAAYPGLLSERVRAEEFNMLPDVMCASIHTHTAVSKHQSLAATRAIPLVILRSDLDRAVSLAKEHFPIFSVALFLPLKSA